MNVLNRLNSAQTWSMMIVLVLVLGSALGQADPGKGTRGMVASVHPLATDAGLNVLKSGGNAVDAAVLA